MVESEFCGPIGLYSVPDWIEEIAESIGKGSETGFFICISEFIRDFTHVDLNPARTVQTNGQCIEPKK